MGPEWSGVRTAMDLLQDRRLQYLG
jgi:hypothetical protein